MKKLIPVFLVTLLLSSCNGWIIQPLPNNPPTPFLPFTPTPFVYTQTPVIIGVTSASSTPAVLTSTPSITATLFPTNTNQPPLTSSFTPTITPTVQVTATNDPNGAPAISVKVLGCNTSIDLTHGMGEVTNAYVVLSNTGNIQLTNLMVTLYALDEGRVHPDKTIELASLPIAHQVTVKLTVDSTYNKDTPIQVEVTSEQGAFPREGLSSCKDIGIFAPKPDGLKTPVPGNS